MPFKTTAIHAGQQPDRSAGLLIVLAYLINDLDTVPSKLPCLP